MTGDERGVSSGTPYEHRLFCLFLTLRLLEPPDSDIECSLSFTSLPPSLSFFGGLGLGLGFPLVIASPAAPPSSAPAPTSSSAPPSYHHFLHLRVNPAACDSEEAFMTLERH